jgi:pimeloyl-ACP methyl ester carboxylesterase
MPATPTPHSSTSTSSSSSSFLGMRPPAAWIDRIASSLAFFPPFPASYTIKRQPDGRRELYVAPTKSSRLPACAFAEAALVPRDGGRKQVAAALIPSPAPPPQSLSSSNSKSGKKRVILFAHGNAVDLAQQLTFLRELSSALARGGAPVAIACFDYQGYGESKSVFSDEGEGAEGAGGDGGGRGGTGRRTAPSAARAAVPASRSDAPAPAPAPQRAGPPDPGASPDSSTAEALADGAAVLQWLLEQKGYQPSEVVLYGQSLGSGVATSLAVALCELERKRRKEEEKSRKKDKGATASSSSSSPPATATPATTTAASSSSSASNGLAAAGLILHSPLASGLRVLKPTWKWWPSALDIFPVAKAASRISADTITKCLVIHGDRDDVVPFENGKAVFDALPPESRVEPLWVKGGGHCDLESTGGYLPRLLKFLKEEIS